jgi:hypothetical protein
LLIADCFWPSEVRIAACFSPSARLIPASALDLAIGALLALGGDLRLHRARDPPARSGSSPLAQHSRPGAAGLEHRDDRAVDHVALCSDWSNSILPPLSARSFEERTMAVT